MMVEQVQFLLMRMPRFETNSGMFPYFAMYVLGARRHRLLLQLSPMLRRVTLRSF